MGGVFQGERAEARAEERGETAVDQHEGEEVSAFEVCTDNDDELTGEVAEKHGGVSLGVFVKLLELIDAGIY